MKTKVIPTIDEFNVVTSKEYYDCIPASKETMPLQLVKAHVEAFRGPIEKVIHEADEHSIFTDVLVVSPTPRHEYYTLVTSGMSFQPMPSTGFPTHMWAELYIHLPTDWKLDGHSLQEHKWNWPVAWLLFMARYPHLRKKWIGRGSYMECAGEAEGCMGETEFAGCMLTGDLGECPDLECLNFNFQMEIFFYNLLPLHKAEIEKVKSSGERSQLEKLFIKNNLNGPLDVKRSSIF
ncbi:suppressor of fused domain protein [Pontiellaceae bacterium B12227]|nr:suppressor of fused domain protein [Pontiellaceae bacterium B12227]